MANMVLSIIGLAWYFSPLVSATFLLDSMTVMDPKLCANEIMPVTSADHQGDCKNVTIFAARGTCESYNKVNETFCWDLPQMIQANNPISEVIHLPYPADYGLHVTYAKSSTLGSNMLGERIKSVAKKCPNTDIILVGFSQGAQVVVDTMCGGGAKPIAGHREDFTACGPIREPLESRYRNHISAAVVFGDPRSVKKASYNMGTKPNNVAGVFPRDDAHQICHGNDAKKIQSYCDIGDKYCAPASLRFVDANAYLDVHSKEHYGQYFANATKFVQKKIESAIKKRADEEKRRKKKVR